MFYTHELLLQQQRPLGGDLLVLGTLARMCLH